MDKNFNERAAQSLPRPLPEPVHRGLAAADFIVEIGTVVLAIAVIVAGLTWLFG